MAKKKEEIKKEEKKQVPKIEKYPVLQLIPESGEDSAIIVGALNKKGLYLQFLDDLENNTEKLKLSKEEFTKMITNFKNGEL